MLLGYRVSQKSVLWPLVAVMLPGWLVLVALVRRPASDWHTQRAFHVRVGAQMEAYDHAESLGGSRNGRASLSSRRAKIESLYRQAHEAGIIKGSQNVEEAIVWLRLGETDKARAALGAVETPEVGGPVYPLTRKAVENQPLDEGGSRKLRELLAASPDDWWLQTLARYQHLETTDAPAFQRHERGSWWRLMLAEWLLPVLGGIALLLAMPAVKLLFGTWTIWPYSERVQRLWPVPLTLCVLSLRGLFLMLGNRVAGLVVPLISWAGQRDPLTVFHIEVALGFVCNALVLIATTWGVKECLAWRWGTLGEVLGFGKAEFLERRLWLITFPCAVALLWMLAPLPALLDQWQVGGPAIFESLTRSPGGHNWLGTLLTVVQAVLLAPFFEEVIYRGFLLSSLRTPLGSPAGIILSSLIFALAHGSSLTGTATAFILGAACAAIKLHTGRLSTAIALHACVAVVQTATLLLQGG